MAARVTTAGTTHHASRSNLSWWDKLRYQLPARVRLHVVRGLTCTLLPELSLSTTLGLPSVRPHNIDAEVEGPHFPWARGGVTLASAWRAPHTGPGGARGQCTHGSHVAAHQRVLPTPHRDSRCSTRRDDTSDGASRRRVGDRAPADRSSGGEETSHPHEQRCIPLAREVATGRGIGPLGELWSCWSPSPPTSGPIESFP